MLGEGSSGWQIKGDNVAVGLNPFTKKLEQYGFPKNFDGIKGMEF